MILDVCKEMFEAREYDIYEESDHVLKATKPNGVRVYLFVLPQEKFNIDIVKYYYRLFLYENIKHAILVYKNQITPSVKKIISGIHSIRIELFCETSFYDNITRHQLVPKHIRISTDGHRDLQKYPSIRKSDPVCRFYGFNTGELIKITRRDGSIYFRVVK